MQVWTIIVGLKATVTNSVDESTLRIGNEELPPSPFLQKKATPARDVDIVEGVSPTLISSRTCQTHHSRWLQTKTDDSIRYFLDRNSQLLHLFGIERLKGYTQILLRHIRSSCSARRPFTMSQRAIGGSFPDAYICEVPQNSNDQERQKLKMSMMTDTGLARSTGKF